MEHSFPYTVVRDAGAGVDNQWRYSEPTTTNVGTNAMLAKDCADE